MRCVTIFYGLLFQTRVLVRSGGLQGREAFVHYRISTTIVVLVAVERVQVGLPRVRISKSYRNVAVP